MTTKNRFIGLRLCDFEVHGRIDEKYLNYNPLYVGYFSGSNLMEIMHKVADQDDVRHSIFVVLVENEKGYFVLSRPVGYGNSRPMIFNATLGNERRYGLGNDQDVSIVFSEGSIV